MKDAYRQWHEYHRTLPKTHRYTLGQRTDDLFIAVIEAIAAAAFLSQKKKLPYVQLAIRKLDTAKVLLLVLWETRSLDNNKYATLSKHLNEVGRMLGGWLKHTNKNSRR